MYYVAEESYCGAERQSDRNGRSRGWLWWLSKPLLIIGLAICISLVTTDIAAAWPEHNRHSIDTEFTDNLSDLDRAWLRKSIADLLSTSNNRSVAAVNSNDPTDIFVHLVTEEGAQISQRLREHDARYWRDVRTGDSRSIANAQEKYLNTSRGVDALRGLPDRRSLTFLKTQHASKLEGSAETWHGELGWSQGTRICKIVYTPRAHCYETVLLREQRSGATLDQMLQAWKLAAGFRIVRHQRPRPLSQIDLKTLSSCQSWGLNMTNGEVNDKKDFLAGLLRAANDCVTQAKTWNNPILSYRPSRYCARPFGFHIPFIFSAEQARRLAGETSTVLCQ